MVSIMDLFGWVGAFVSICFFSSPILKFIQLIKKKIQYKDINILIIQRYKYTNNSRKLY